MGNEASFGRFVYGISTVPAILAMLQLSSGTFSVTNDVHPAEIGIKVSITNILLEYARIKDER